MRRLLPAINDYLSRGPLSDVPGWECCAPFGVAPLAQGEYNMNYRIQQDGRAWVLRLSVASQIELDSPQQIIYEARTLRMLAPSGVTPQVHFVDPDPDGLPYGLLLMKYLPGESLDYRRDLADAARLFARVHSVTVASADNHLIREAQPLSETYRECTTLLDVYLKSDLADPALRGYLREVLAWAEEARAREAYFVADPWSCIINTEVNSGNFIANRVAGTLHLVDWEKPLWGDPSQDLSHFCVPTTTLWKTDYRMSPTDRQAVIDAYRAALVDAHLRDTIEDRVRLRDPFNCLRGISWSAMAWVSYQTGDHALRNADTYAKVQQYLQLDFVRTLFDPYLTAGAA